MELIIYWMHSNTRWSYVPLTSQLLSGQEAEPIKLYLEVKISPWSFHFHSKQIQNFQMHHYQYNFKFQSFLFQGFFHFSDKALIEPFHKLGGIILSPTLHEFVIKTGNFCFCWEHVSLYAWSMPHSTRVNRSSCISCSGAFAP